MSDVIIFKLNTQEDYESWYAFLNWFDPRTVTEVSSWDDSAFSNTIYKAYKIDDVKDLSFILLKWAPTLKGEYGEWLAMKRNIEMTVYKDEDINWIDKDV